VKFKQGKRGAVNRTAKVALWLGQPGRLGNLVLGRVQTPKMIKSIGGHWFSVQRQLHSKREAQTGFAWGKVELKNSSVGG